MTIQLHENLPTGRIHKVIDGTYADSSARTAESGFTSGNVDKVYKQLDNNSYWVVESVSAGVPTWKEISFSPSGTSTQLVVGDGSYVEKLDLPISTATQSALDLKLDSSSYVQHFKGVYTSFSGLTTAHPTAIAGDYAQVDAGSGSNLNLYTYDLQEGWLLSVAGTATNTDVVPEGSTNLYFTAARVRSAVLTGLSLATNQVIAATDTVLQAFGYLQKQITDLTTTVSGKQNTLVSGTNIKTVNSNSLLGSGDISVGTVTATSTDTLTNKRITARVGSTTSSATPTINTDNVDIYKLTAQAVDISSFTTNLSGTPTDGQILEIIITGTAARAITWGTSFASSTITLPTTTVTTNTLRITLQWDSVVSKWICVGVA